MDAYGREWLAVVDCGKLDVIHAVQVVVDQELEDVWEMRVKGLKGLLHHRALYACSIMM